MKFNFLICALAALVPMIIGFVWYGPLFGKAWMKEMGFTEESLKGGNMLKIFGLSYVCSFLIAFVLQTLVIHQWGAFSTLMGEPGFTEGSGGASTYFQEFMSNFGDRFRTFGHGALHGTMIGLLLAGSIITINGLFERKSFKYIAINVGYWVVSLAIMGGVLCKWV
ncbi:DUF1761 domain-containing protein [Tenacibaculum sp. HL-MS23]|uniref:DUF1761 domain-containing protein n=1 Tax=Tenacibaculum TaxID=104267 RepID=UPI001C4EAA52|nr:MULTISPECIES: DUF1761 domain-containing protein [Tenacibaculum]QXP73228.1 DUF1761 domain-containing protein [Tenacibaculum sp. AHE14PA]QXP77141.1 DUF1761 domain-containing protein [Tenacibaculum sp. AHE15PA]WNW01278.1 DUF1761 domain-containing protein [Tenacibaculum sp. HL-MS23]